MKLTGTRLAVAVTAAAVAATGLTLGAAQADAQQATHAVPRCTNHSLTVTNTFAQGAAGHSYLALVYRNDTTRACTVGGYPGVDAITHGGHVLAHAKRVRGTTPLRTITVRPRHFASASLEWRNFTGRTGRSCRTSAAIDTIVANTTRVHRLPARVGVCGLQVSPTVSGLPGYPRYAEAQHDWITASTVDAQGMIMYFADAAGELKHAGLYSTQVAQLRQLASFPLTGLNHKQVKEARADVKALDGFFATPGLFR